MTVLAPSSCQSLAATDFRARWIAAPAAALGSRERARTLLAGGRLVLDPNAPHPAEEALWFARAARALSGRFGWGLLWELRLIGDLEAWAVRVGRGEHRDLALEDDGLPRPASSGPCVHLAARTTALPGGRSSWSSRTEAGHRPPAPGLDARRA